MTFKKLTTAIATGAVLINAMAPIALANTITVTGNGALSTNNVTEVTTNVTKVDQTNNAKVNNNIDSNATTGGNSASFNTGGTTQIVTGNAKNDIDVSTAVNLNKVDLKNCGQCNGGAVNVTVSGNGATSDNNVDVIKSNELFLNQDNNAHVNNKINANASTGKNDSSFNTGGASITVTGNAESKVNVDNKANANIAEVGGGNSAQNSSGVTITGNGSLSNNNVTLTETSLTELMQTNIADIRNDVKAKAETGENKSSFNTGGMTIISTGNAKTDVAVDNMVNFNAAKVDCECILGNLNAKIGGNGATSLNNITADNINSLFEIQDNLADLLNDVNGKAKTGLNDVSFSTGSPMSDPMIATGNAKSSDDVSNAGNVNIFNEGHSLQLPGGVQIEFELEFEHILHSIHMG